MELLKSFSACFEKEGQREHAGGRGKGERRGDRVVRRMENTASNAAYRRAGGKEAQHARGQRKRTPPHRPCPSVNSY